MEYGLDSSMDVHVLFSKILMKSSQILFTYEIIEEVVNVLVAKLLKEAVSRNSAKLGNYKMPVKLRET